LSSLERVLHRFHGFELLSCRSGEVIDQTSLLKDSLIGLSEPSATILTAMFGLAVFAGALCGRLLNPPERAFSQLPTIPLLLSPAILFSTLDILYFFGVDRHGH